MEMDKFIEKIKYLNINKKSLDIIKSILEEEQLQNDQLNENQIYQFIHIEEINNKFFKLNKNLKSVLGFCSICQENIKKGQHKITLCNCNHIFHKKCVNKYLKIKKLNFKCPNCNESYSSILTKIAEEC